MATLPPLSLVAIYPHPSRPLASSPAPGGGGGSRGDTRGKPHPGERTPAPAFSPGSPPYPGPWGHLHGGGADGEGAKSPSPVSGCNMPASPTPPPSLCFQYATYRPPRPDRPTVHCPGRAWRSRDPATRAPTYPATQRFT